MGLVTLWFQYVRNIGQDIVRSDSFLSRLAGAGWAVWFYLYKAIIPYKLSFVYPRWEINTSSLISYLPILILLGCFLVLFKYRRSWTRPLLFGFGYYVVTLFPVLGFFNIYFMKYSLVADHWQYFSIVGIIALFVSGGYLLSTRYHKIRYLITTSAVILIILFGILTYRQCQIYKDVETLWFDTIAKNPKCWMAYNNLGFFYNDINKKEAITSYKKAIAIKPNYTEAYSNLGSVYNDINKKEEAIASLKKAIEINPNYAQAYNNLGDVYIDDTITAITLFKKAIAIKPNFTEAYYNLGNAYKDIGKREEAIKAYKKAIKIDPQYANAYSNLGAVYSAMNRKEEAITSYEKAIEINPQLAEAHYNLGNLYNDINKKQEAITSYKKAIAINLNYAQAHNNLSVAYYRDKQYNLAIEHCDKALELGHNIHPEFLKLLEPYRSQGSES